MHESVQQMEFALAWLARDDIFAPTFALHSNANRRPTSGRAQARSARASSPLAGEVRRETTGGAPASNWAAELSRAAGELSRAQGARASRFELSRGEARRVIRVIE